MAVFKKTVFDSNGLLGIAADGLVAAKLVRMIDSLLFPGKEYQKKY
jgi:hypothetical protein